VGSRMSSWRAAVLLVAIGLLALGLGLGALLEESKQAESWIIAGAAVSLGEGMCAAGLLYIPREKANDVPVVAAPDGQLIVIPIRSARFSWAGCSAGSWCRASPSVRCGFTILRGSAGRPLASERRLYSAGSG
jgi:hypothetical protein